MMKISGDRFVIVLTISIIFFAMFGGQTIARDTAADEFNAIASFIASPPSATWKGYAYSQQSMPQTGERDAVDVQLRRTRTLLDEFNTNGTLDSLDAALTALEAENNTIPVNNTSARLVFFREVDALSRKVAFANPLLNFKDIVFLKREFSWYTHMVDSYFGHKANPGGGIYILENAFSDNPQENQRGSDTFFAHLAFSRFIFRFRFLISIQSVTVTSFNIFHTTRSRKSGPDREL